MHRGITFSIEQPGIVAIIGDSGSGKSVLLREILGLMAPTSGEITLLGHPVTSSAQEELTPVRNRCGVLFQNGALFSALTVEENISVPFREHTKLPADLVHALVELRLALVGLPPEVGIKMPSELSGGMRKRVGLARALALEPELLFLDEPTSGLDPISSRAFDTLVHTLSRSLGITVILVTHDLDTLEGIVDRVIALSDGRVIADGPVAEVRRSEAPWIHSYFSARSAERARQS